MKNWILKFAILGNVLSVSGIGYAQPMNIDDPEAIIPKIAPQTIYEQGQPVLIRIDDQYEARLVKSKTKPNRLKIKLDLVESLCADNYVTPKCSYGIDVSSEHFNLIWTKHPSRIGKLVQIKMFTISNPPLSQEAFKEFDIPTVETYLNKNGNYDKSRFAADTLACDNYDWTGTSETVTKLLVNTWTSEFMFANRETSINENASGSTIENVLFNKNSNGYSIVSAGKVISTVSFSEEYIILPVGNVNTLLLTNPSSSELCQVSFSQNLAAAIAGIDLDKGYKENPNFQTVIFNREIKLNVYERLKSQIYFNQDYKTVFK